jgi:phage-related protein
VGEVSKQSGKSRAEIEKTGVTYEQTAAALKALTSEGGQYNGMLAKQMNTLGGVLKQFASFKAATAEAIGTGISDELKDMLKYLLELARAGQDTFVGSFVKAIKEVIHWIFQIMIMFEVLQYRIEDAAGGFDVFKQFFESLRDIAGHVLMGVMHLIVAVGRTFVEAFKTAYTLMAPIWSELGPMIEKAFRFASDGIIGLIPIIQALRPPLAVVGTVLGVIVKGIGGMLDFLSPLAPVIMGIIAVIKIWTIIQWALNAAMMANPIGLIVAAVIAGVALIVGLVMVIIDNWDAIVEFFVWLGGVIADAFMWVVNKIADFFTWVIEKIKAIWEKIKAFFITFGKQIANIFFVLVNKIKQAFQWVVDRAIAIWNTLKSWFGVLVEAIKGIWLAIKGWFAGLWDGIVNTAMAVWDTLKSWFSGLVEGIKNIWNGIVGFFSGLWEAMKQGPAAAVEFIKNAFFGLFNSIQEKLFGFINTIGEGWESVKGFFGDIADGVVNFFTGGDSSEGQVQPAYAGASHAAMSGAVGPTSNYAYTSTGGSSTVNAQTSINVAVPQGTSQEQSEAIARQIDAQFSAKLAGSIDSTRANIPSPEVRRH